MTLDPPLYSVSAYINIVLFTLETDHFQHFQSKCSQNTKDINFTSFFLSFSSSEQRVQIPVVLIVIRCLFICMLLLFDLFLNICLIILLFIFIIIIIYYYFLKNVFFFFNFIFLLLLKKNCIFFFGGGCNCIFFNIQ